MLPRKKRVAKVKKPTTANAGPVTKPLTGKSAIVTSRKPRSWRSDVPDMTPEEHKRRGDAADAMFREMKRKIAAAVRPGDTQPPPKRGRR